MIVDCYDPVNLFEMVPKLNLEMEPELAELDRLLDDDAICERVKKDFSKRYPNSATRGRRSTPVEVVLRMLVVKRLYGFSYEQTERIVSDSIVLRQFFAACTSNPLRMTPPSFAGRTPSARIPSKPSMIAPSSLLAH